MPPTEYSEIRAGGDRFAPGVLREIISVLLAPTIGGLCVVLSGCSRPAEETPAPASPVQTIVIEEGAASPFRRFPGTVSATQSTQLSFDVAGRLVEFPATQGLVVARGELLGLLDPENFQAELDAATARFENARDELERRRQLRERGVISDSEFEQFRKDFEVAQAAQRTARRALDDTRLVAPFDGRVARTLVNNQQNVQAKQPVLVFQNLAVLEIDIQIPESDMLLGERGVTAENARERLEAQVEFPALPGRRFDLDLKSFSTEATEAARTFRVTFYFEPPAEQNILPGMTSTVLLRRIGGTEVVDGEADVFLVPVQAVAAAGGTGWVWRLDPDSMAVSRVEVEMLGVSGDSMQIRATDLQTGDELVSSGVRFLSDGMTVRRMRSQTP